jgi:hypothetical protein
VPGPLKVIGETVPIKADFFLDNNGVTSLTPAVSIRKLSNNEYLQNGGASFGASFATNNMSEVDSTNEPGTYLYNFDQSADTDGTAENYLVRISGIVNGQDKFLTQIVSFEKDPDFVVEQLSGTMLSEFSDVKGADFDATSDSLDAISAAVSGIDASSSGVSEETILALSGTLIVEHDTTQSLITSTSGTIISEINDGIEPTGVVDLVIDVGI